MNIYTTHQVGGHKRGLKMGVPTINLQVPTHFDYEHGIYAGKIGLVRVGAAARTWYPAAIHFGFKPTFDEDDVTLEVNIIDTEPQNIIPYDPGNIQVCLTKRIREIVKFDTPTFLVEQIQKDIALIRSLLRDDK
ncbi:MAG: riboflavin kinase [bacterium]